CNPSLLTTEQSQIVKQEALDRNFRNCKHGFADCNPSLLTTEQNQIVKQEALDRNFRSCKHGFADCNPSLLTVDRDEVVESAKVVVNKAKDKSLVFNVQHKLKNLGYGIGHRGQWDDKSQSAANQFIHDYGLEVVAGYRQLLPYLQQAEAGKLKRVIKSEEAESTVEIAVPKPEVIEPEVVDSDVVEPEPVATANPKPIIFDQFYEERKPTVLVEPTVEITVPDSEVKPEVAEPTVEQVIPLPKAKLEVVEPTVDMAVPESEKKPEMVEPMVEIALPEFEVKPRAVPNSSKDFNISEYSFGDLLFPPALKTLLIVLVGVTIWSVLWKWFKAKPDSDSEQEQEQDSKNNQKQSTQQTSEIKSESPVAPIPEPSYQAVVTKMVAAIEGSEKLLEFAHHFKYLPLKPVVGTWFGTVERWAKRCQGDVNLMTEAFLNHYESRLEQRFLEKSCDLNSIPTPEYLLLDVKFQSFWEQEAYYRQYADYPPDWVARRTLVSMREQALCQRCGVLCDLNKAHIHHIIPKAQGGGHGLDNLAFLCRDCHSCMPSEGHLDIRGYTRYLVSNTRKLHTPECKYGGKSIWGKASSWQWQNDYTYCRLCDPLAYHHKQVQAWKPDIVRVFSSYREKIRHELEASC
ncbi:MAG: HNH endonuclease, partial [Thiofilum sp.]